MPDALKRGWSYLPSHGGQAPPVAIPEDDPERRIDDVGQLVPVRCQQAYNMRRLMERIADHGSLFEVGERFGPALIPSLARLDGQVVGVVANQPLVQAGAAGPDEAGHRLYLLVRLLSHPPIFLHDLPGFRVARMAEHKKMPTKIMVWNQALARGYCAKDFGCRAEEHWGRRIAIWRGRRWVPIWWWHGPGWKSSLLVLTSASTWSTRNSWRRLTIPRACAKNCWSAGNLSTPRIQRPENIWCMI